MSEASWDNHGVNDSERPAVLSICAYLEGFQYCELTSGSVAAPKSPKPLAAASGEMLSEGTELTMGLYLLAERAETANIKNKQAARIILFFFIRIWTSLEYQ